MRKPTKSERFKYVQYDPDGRLVLGNHCRTKWVMKRASDLPWIGRPMFSSGWDGVRKNIQASKRFATEREAALFVDKWFINHGREPVNILVRKP